MLTYHVAVMLEERVGQQVERRPDRRHMGRVSVTDE